MKVDDPQDRRLSMHWQLRDHLRWICPNGFYYVKHFDVERRRWREQKKAERATVEQEA